MNEDGMQSVTKSATISELLLDTRLQCPNIFVKLYLSDSTLYIEHTVNLFPKVLLIKLKSVQKFSGNMLFGTRDRKFFEESPRHR